MEERTYLADFEGVWRTKNITGSVDWAMFSKTRSVIKIGWLIAKAYLSIFLKQDQSSRESESFKPNAHLKAIMLHY